MVGFRTKIPQTRQPQNHTRTENHQRGRVIYVSPSYEMKCLQANVHRRSPFQWRRPRIETAKTVTQHSQYDERQDQNQHTTKPKRSAPTSRAIARAYLDSPRENAVKPDDVCRCCCCWRRSDCVSNKELPVDARFLQCFVSPSNFSPLTTFSAQAVEAQKKRNSTH